MAPPSGPAAAPSGHASFLLATAAAPASTGFSLGAAATPAAASRAATPSAGGFNFAAAAATPVAGVAAAAPAAGGFSFGAAAAALAAAAAPASTGFSLGSYSNAKVSSMSFSPGGTNSATNSRRKVRVPKKDGIPRPQDTVPSTGLFGTSQPKSPLSFGGKCDFGFKFGKGGAADPTFNNIFSPTQQLSFATTACTTAVRHPTGISGSGLPSILVLMKNLRAAIAKAKALGAEETCIVVGEAALVETTEALEKKLTEKLSNAMEKRDLQEIKKYTDLAQKAELGKDLRDKAAALVEEHTALFAETPAIVLVGRVGKCSEFMGTYLKQDSSGICGGMVNGAPLFAKKPNPKAASGNLFMNTQFLFKGSSGRWLINEGQGSYICDTSETANGGSKFSIRSTSAAAMLPTAEGLQFEYWDGTQHTLDECINAALPAVSMRQAIDNRNLEHLRSTLAAAEEDKLVEGAMIEEARALVGALASEEATNQLQEVIKNRDPQALQSAITAVEAKLEKLVADELIEDAKATLRALANTSIEKALKESQWRCSSVSDLTDAFSGLRVEDKEAETPDRSATAAVSGPNASFPLPRDWHALHDLQKSLETFAGAADKALVAAATSEAEKQQAALVAASPVAVSVEGRVGTMKKMMGTYVKAEDGRVVNGAPLYVKMATTAQQSFLFKGKSGEWRFTSMEEKIDITKGMMRSTSTAVLPTEEGLQFEYLNGHKFVLDELVTAVLPLERLRQAIDKHDLDNLRSALSKAEQEKLVDGAVIEEARVLVTVLAFTAATEKLQQATENRELQALRSAVATAEEEKLVAEAVLAKAKEVVLALATKRLQEAIEKRDQKHLKVVLDSEIEHNVLDKATIDDASVALERLHIQRVMESRDLPSLRSAIAVAEEKGRVDSALLKEAHALVTVLASMALRKAIVKRSEEELKEAIKTARDISICRQAQRRDYDLLLPLNEAESTVAEIAHERLRKAVNKCDAATLRSAILTAEQENLVDAWDIAEAKAELILIPLKLSIGKCNLRELRKTINLAEKEIADKLKVQQEIAEDECDDRGYYVGCYSEQAVAARAQFADEKHLTVKNERSRAAAVLAEAKAQISALATMRLREAIEKRDVKELMFLVPLEEQEAVVDIGLIDQAKALVDAEGPSECCICFSETVDCRLDPCGHVAICSTCSDAIVSRAMARGAAPKCPICRTQVKSATKFGSEVLGTRF